MINTGSTMTALSLSSNKLVVLYNDRVDYYRMVGTGIDASIELLFTKNYDETDIEDDGSYRFGLSCMCNAMKRFSCYSSTLNCMIIKKAGDACGDRDLPDV